jgi:hypothetical protein
VSAYVYLGSATGLSGGYAWTSVATAGDVNGAGYADVLAGAFQYDNGQADAGRAYVYYGNGGGLRAAPRQLRTNLATPIDHRMPVSSGPGKDFVTTPTR